MLQVLKSLAVTKAKPKEKPYKLTDGGGLYLLVNKAGKYWRYNYRHMGKRKTLALGVFPTVTLENARERHLKAKRELELHNNDPADTQSNKGVNRHQQGGNSGFYRHVVKTC